MSESALHPQIDVSADSMGRPIKRSLTLRGHRTSVSLEDPFWTAFCDLAKETGKPINVLAAEIDTLRGVESGLASAIRVYVLEYYITKSAHTTAVDSNHTNAHDGA